MYDMTADTMGLLLDFLYGAPKPSLTFEEAADLFVVSDQYAIMELHLQCTRILKAMITMETVCMLTRLACDHLNTDLEQVNSAGLAAASDCLCILIAVTCSMAGMCTYSHLCNFVGLSAFNIVWHQAHLECMIIEHCFSK